MIALDKTARDALARLLRRRLLDTLDVEIDPVDSGELIDFLSETLGPHYYNQGLRDAQAIVKSKVEAIVDAVYDLERKAKTY